MNFTQAVSEVVSTVGRPDLIGRVRREVNSAIAFYVIDMDAPQDFAEQSVAIDANEYTQAFALSELTRFRKFKYIKRGGTKKYLSVVSDKEMMEGCTLRDRYYQVGTSVNVYLHTLAATLDVGYYSYPSLLTDDVDSRSHWLLDYQPYMVIERACGTMFRSMGDEKSMTTSLAMAKELYTAARKDLLSNQ
jgi:hypothetical protein